MSIYATTLHLSDDNHEDDCAIYVEDPPGSGAYEFSGNPCNCTQPNAPWRYQGSHVLPALSDEKHGTLSLAMVPAFITRDGRDDGHEGPKDWLRVSIYASGDAVVINRAQAEQLRDAVTEWLERAE